MLPRRATVSMIYNGANATEQVAGYINSFEYVDVAAGNIFKQQIRRLPCFSQSGNLKEESASGVSKAQFMP